MEALSGDIHERSRKNHSALLQGLSRAGQVRVASALEVSESTVSRMKGDFQQLSKLLAACGLKVVPSEYKCAKPEMIEAALIFARAALEQTSKDNSLIWDD